MISLTDHYRDVGGAASPCSTLSSILTKISIFGVLEHVGCIEKFNNKRKKIGSHSSYLPPHYLVTVVCFVACFLLRSCVKTATAVTNQVVITLFALVPVQKV